MSRPKRYPTSPLIDKLNKGPTLPYFQDVKRYRVKYRYRERYDDGTKWIVNQIEMVCRNEDVARYRVIQQVRSRYEVEVMRVEEVGAEQEIQTGRKVTTVSQKEYRDMRENELAASEEERKEALREQGFIIP